MPEDINRIWEEQLAYNSLVKAAVENPDRLGTLVLGLQEECGELLRAAGWKKHRKPEALGGGAVSADAQAVLEELADIFKYCLSLAQDLGFSLEELLRAVQIKNEAMRQRLEQEFSPPPSGRRVLIADLDGTLADYASGMRELLVAAGLPEEPDRVKYPEYWRVRRHWEETGGYRRLKPYLDGVELVKTAQRAGAYILVVTARPTSVKRVWYDSLLWLADNGIRPDRLVLADSERVLLLENLQKAGCKVLLLEDDPVLARRAAAICPVLVRTHEYNKHLEGEGIVHTGKFNLLDLERLWNGCA